MKFNFIRVWGDCWSKRGSDLFFPQETGQVADHLYAIRDRDVNLFLYSDGENTLCIDAGYIDNDYLEGEFEKTSIEPASITHLFLTHTDMDHAGGIDKDSKANCFPNAKVFMGRDEVGMIDGSIARRFVFLNPVEITRPCNLLDDGDVITVGTVAVQAIATPGHTTGHMAYLINDDILVAGDALVLIDNRVEPFYHTWNLNHEQVIESVKKLAVLENIAVLCTAHTQCSYDFDEAIRNWRTPGI